MINVLEQFAKGVHRVALHEPGDTERITGVVSQSAFMRWLLPRLNEMGDPVNRTLQELGQLGFGEVLTVRCVVPCLLVCRSHVARSKTRTRRFSRCAASACSAFRPQRLSTPTEKLLKVSVRRPQCTLLLQTLNRSATIRRGCRDFD